MDNSPPRFGEQAARITWRRNFVILQFLPVLAIGLALQCCRARPPLDAPRPRARDCNYKNAHSQVDTEYSACTYIYRASSLATPGVWGSQKKVKRRCTAVTASHISLQAGGRRPPSTDMIYGSSWVVTRLLGSPTVVQSTMDVLVDSQSALQLNEIRVLDLQPGRWTDEIVCDLRVVSLDSKSSTPSYEAISYAWGNPQDTVPIKVDGKVLQATKNLHLALRRLRSKDDARTLWADALCINQHDVDERTQQVGIMQDIYSKAKSVQVYLGESAILDAIPLEEQESWDEPPQIQWHRDATLLLQTREPGWTVVSWDDTAVRNGRGVSMP